MNGHLHTTAAKERMKLCKRWQSMTFSSFACPDRQNSYVGSLCIKQDQANAYFSGCLQVSPEQMLLSLSQVVKIYPCLLSLTWHAQRQPSRQKTGSNRLASLG